MPVIIAGNEQQQKKYLGRMTEEPLMCVSMYSCCWMSLLSKGTGCCFPFSIYKYTLGYSTLRQKLPTYLDMMIFLGCQETVIIITLGYFQVEDTYLR